jgi:hypothetical protein
MPKKEKVVRMTSVSKDVQTYHRVFTCKLCRAGLLKENPDDTSKDAVSTKRDEYIST